MTEHPARTERLSFRTWTMDDLSLALALWGDYRVTRLIGGPFDDEAVLKRLNRELEHQRLHRFQYWPMFLLESGAHAGCAGLKPYDLSQGIIEMGFQLRAEHFGRGLALEAGRAVVAHAFRISGARALFAGHHPDNAASRRVLEKLGLRYTHSELYPPTGLMHPSYRLSREDWEAPPAQGTCSTFPWSNT
jgi:RimJ/RimL family protein N-acetyltransferase